jgi:hypothetical protein
VVGASAVVAGRGRGICGRGRGRGRPGPRAWRGRPRGAGAWGGAAAVWSERRGRLQEIERDRLRKVREKIRLRRGLK